MMPPIILPILERMLNQYLKLDMEMKQQLNRYHGKVIGIHISTIQWQFVLCINHDTVELRSSVNKPLDASIKASINELAKNLMTDSVSLTPEIELTGDVALLHTITKLFKSVEIDWEELLANYTGDEMAHSFGGLIRSIKNYSQQVCQSGFMNFKEYLEEEIQLLTNAYGVDDFCKDVDEFRDSVERIEARINLVKVVH